MDTHDLMLPNAHTYRTIVVTGPQRSGTTFMTKAIAHDTERAPVDEVVFAVNNYNLWRSIVEISIHTVIQCPTMMKHVHDLPSDVMVVVMIRDIEEIVSSEKRVGWDYNDVELEQYGADKGVISEVRYDYWNKHKDLGPPNWVEIEYTSMKHHPLWINPENRKNFKAKQTEL